MKKLFVFIVCLITVFAIESCNKHTFSTASMNSSTNHKRSTTKEAEHHNVPLTPEIIKNYGLTVDAHLKKLQYYLEGEILLSVEINTPYSQVEGGTLNVGAVTVPLEVRIPSGTSGVYETSKFNGNYDDLALGIRFEQDGSGRWLWFHPNKNLEGKFFLAAKNQNNRFEVSYDGRTYTASILSTSAFLSIDINQLIKVDPQKRVVTGVQLGGSSE